MSKGSREFETHLKDGPLFRAPREELGMLLAGDTLLETLWEEVVLFSCARRVDGEAVVVEETISMVGIELNAKRSCP